ncbi:MAG: biotin/lipoyl-binding protein [Pseudomonadota bacterium]|nr:biotin/lipoyl-binding protein [Pseudomonadota bacterium]
MPYFNKIVNLAIAKSALLILGLMALSIGHAAAESSSVKIGSLVSGQVTKVFIEEGQTVKQGQKLLNLDGARYQAKLTLLNTHKKVAKLDLDDAKIELDQALDLYDRTVTSKRTRDASQLRYDLAKASYEKAKAEVAVHQAWSKYVYIKSPVNGKIAKIFAPIGTTVYKENTIMLEIEAE